MEKLRNRILIWFVLIWFDFIRKTQAIWRIWRIWRRRIACVGITPPSIPIYISDRENNRRNITRMTWIDKLDKIEDGYGNKTPVEKIGDRL